MELRNAFAVLSRGFIATFFVAFIMVLVGVWALDRANDKAINEALESATDTAALSVADRLSLYQYGLRGARGVVVTSGVEGLSRELFRRYSHTRDLDAEFPGARGFGFIRRVPAGDLQAFLDATRADGRPDFAIRELFPNANDRFIIQYIEPAEANLPAIGLDIASEANRRNAAIAAMRAGKAQLTGPITLVQATGNPKQSFLILLPVYDTPDTPASEAEREARTIGWTYAPLLSEDVLKGLDINHGGATRLQLTDVTDPGQSTVFYASPGQTSRYSQRVEREVLGRRWQIELMAQPAFINGLHLSSPKVMLLLGTLLSLLLASLASAVSLSRRREHEVGTQQARLADIVESSEDAIISKSVTGIVTSWNPGAERLFGYKANEAIGKPIVELILPDALLAEEARIIAGARAGERISNFETVRRRRDGGEIHVAISVSPIYGFGGVITGISKTVRNISERKKAEEKILQLNTRLEEQVAQRTSELQALNLMFSGVLDSAYEVSIIATDLSGLIKVFNIGAERLLGYRADEVVDQQNLTLFHDPQELLNRQIELTRQSHRPVDTLDALVQEARVNHSEIRDWHYERKDGSRVPVRLVVTAMHDASNEIKGYLGIAIDITKQRELEISLRQAKEQADSANSAKSSFLANMSHEIRTPLNAILGMQQLILKTPLSPIQLDYVLKANTASKSLLGLLNDILDYSKIEAGKMQLDPHPFELETLMQNLAVILMGNKPGRDVEVMFNTVGHMPRTLVGDSLRLKQILINLAGNALKFTEKGHVIIGVELLSLGSVSATLRFSVIDTGIGISAHQLGLIFEGFTQAEASTTRRFGGTGLGLVICSRLIEQMGSKLNVESEPGKGSHFWFDMPLDLIDDAEPVEHTLDDRSLRVLIVDDNAMARDIMERMLSGFGWQTELASSGMQALERVSHAPEDTFDVVLMDWQMPEMDGIEVATALQAMSRTRPLPILMTTAHSSEELISAVEAHASPYFGAISKLVTAAQLRVALQEVVCGTRPHHPAAPSHGALSTRLQGLHLLVVEDNAINRQIAAEFLQSEGAQVSLAQNGVEAVRRVVTNGEVFDAILMDIQMPEMDGYQATRKIREVPDFAALPIIAMTANVSDSDRTRCLDAGMNDHIGKPVDLDIMVDTVLSNLGRAPSAVGTAVTTPRTERTQDLIEARERILQRFGGNIELITTVLKTLGPELERLLTQLQACVEKQDVNQALNVLHTIKGCAGSAGAAGLAAHASDMEKALHASPEENGRSALVPSMFDPMRELIVTSLERLHSSFSVVIEAPASATPGALPDAQWRKELGHLLSLLEEGNLDVIDRAEALGRQTAAHHKPDYDEFLSQVQSLNFPAATILAKKIANPL